MLSVEEATQAVLQAARALPPVIVDLPNALGCHLAESIRADRDSPPFSKALLDGFAVQSADFHGGSAELRIIEEVTAGRVPRRTVEPGEATAIMTGAPMPEGADAVVMVEHSERRGDLVLLQPPQVPKPGYGWLERGREMHRDETILEPGALLGPVHLGLMATVGHARPRVIPRPRVAIASTGDEIVPETETPGPGQIRNSNAPMLEALCKSAGAIPTRLPIARDDRDTLATILAQGLQDDVLIITGGVSAGKLDLVPGVLEQLGVRPMFHKVRLKPGKPLFFGVGPERGSSRPPALVFALPGNPVSGLVGFLLFVQPALTVLAGGPAAPAPTRTDGVLIEPYSHRGDRPTFHPAQWLSPDAPHTPPRLRPLPWAGSPDLRALAAADGFIRFPPGDAQYGPGDSFPFLSLSLGGKSRL